ncbi:MAG: hypothetical protein AMJ56_12805 [Anaerolineae bacterium SG8_19]|nr:MAG: hypothetical protein AMJ56_12805 [Anaerolineae bacterium SG8_19]
MKRQLADRQTLVRLVPLTHFNYFGYEPLIARQFQRMPGPSFFDNSRVSANARNTIYLGIYL